MNFDIGDNVNFKVGDRFRINDKSHGEWIGAEGIVLEITKSGSVRAQMTFESGDDRDVYLCHNSGLNRVFEPLNKVDPTEGWFS